MSLRAILLACVLVTFACRVPEQESKFSKIDGGVSTEPPPFGSYVYPAGSGGSSSSDDAGVPADGSDAVSTDSAAPDALPAGSRYAGLHEECPYEAASGTVDCAALCNRVEACRSDPGCRQACGDAARIFSTAAMSAIQSCAFSMRCSQIPETTYLHDLCLATNIRSLGGSGMQVCELIATRAQSCGRTAAQARAERAVCVENLAPVLRQEVVTAMTRCTTAACVDLDACVRAALCGYRVRIEEGVAQAFP